MTSQEILGVTGDGVGVFDGTSFTNLFGVGVVLQIIGVVNTGFAGVIDVITDTSGIAGNAFACRVFGVLGGDGHVVSIPAGLALTSGGADGTSVDAGAVRAFVFVIQPVSILALGADTFFGEFGAPVDGSTNSGVSKGGAEKSVCGGTGFSTDGPEFTTVCGSGSIGHFVAAFSNRGLTSIRALFASLSCGIEKISCEAAVAAPE